MAWFNGFCASFPDVSGALACGDDRAVHADKGIQSERLMQIVH